MLWHCVNVEKTLLEQQQPPAAHEKKKIFTYFCRINDLKAFNCWQSIEMLCLKFSRTVETSK